MKLWSFSKFLTEEIVLEIQTEYHVLYLTTFPTLNMYDKYVSYIFGIEEERLSSNRID